ncbi:MAG: NUDIX hydrolase [Oscillospiraceae bacterium]|nr:NUDIX hydrolase [Oscillospiraceae bacterium]
MAEYWDLYDINGNPLNELHERGKPVPDGKYHLVADILSVNDEGKILITQRHPEKHYGGSWENTGGSVLAGEAPLDAAVRELAEETGLKAAPEQLEYCGEIVRSGKWGGNAIHKYYLYRGSFSEKDIVLQENETVDFKLVTPSEITAMTENGEFIDFIYYRIRAMYPDIMEKK